VEEQNGDDCDGAQTFDVAPMLHGITLVGDLRTRRESPRIVRRRPP